MQEETFRFPPVIKKVVTTVVGSERAKSYSLSQRYQLIRCILGYTLRLMDAKDNGGTAAKMPLPTMKSILSSSEFDLSHNEIIHLSTVIKENLSLIISVKNLIYRFLQTQETSSREVTYWFKRLGLKKSDANLYFWLKDLELYEPALFKLRQAQDEFLPPEAVKRKCQQAVLKLWAPKYNRKQGKSYLSTHPIVKRTFNFIYTYNPDISQEDVTQYLIYKAAFVYFLEYPFFSEAHLVNKMKSSIGNNGQNHLKKFTREDFARVKREFSSHGNEHFRVQEISYYGTGENGTFLKHESAHDMQPQQEEENNVLRMSVSVLVNKATHKQRRVLHLLMRKHKSSFLKYASEHYPPQDDSTFTHYESADEVHEKIGGKQYLEAVRTYVGMNKKQFQAYLLTLQKELAVNE